MYSVCTGLTQLYLILDKVQLLVSALDNGHLQVVHEILIKYLYKTYKSCLYGVWRR